MWAIMIIHHLRSHIVLIKSLLIYIRGRGKILINGIEILIAQDDDPRDWVEIDTKDKEYLRCLIRNFPHLYHGAVALEVSRMWCTDCEKGLHTYERFYCPNCDQPYCERCIGEH